MTDATATGGAGGEESRPVLPDILRFSSQAADTAPGDTPLDTVSDRKVYATLAATPHWRRILSLEHPRPLRVHDREFSSPRHAIAHAQIVHKIKLLGATPIRVETADELRARAITAESVRVGAWDAVRDLKLTPAEARTAHVAGLQEIARTLTLDSGSELSRESPGSVTRYLRHMGGRVPRDWTEKLPSFNFHRRDLAVMGLSEHQDRSISPHDVARAWVRRAQFAPGTEARRVLLATGDAELWRGVSWEEPRRETALETLRASIRRAA